MAEEDVEKLQEAAEAQAAESKPKERTKSIVVPATFVQTFAYSKDGTPTEKNRARVLVPVPGEDGKRAAMFTSSKAVKDMAADPNHKRVLLFNDSYKLSDRVKNPETGARETKVYGEFSADDIVQANVEANNAYEQSHNFNDKKLVVSPKVVGGPYPVSGTYKSGPNAGKAYSYNNMRIGLPNPQDPSKLVNIFVPEQYTAPRGKDLANPTSYLVNLTRPYTATEFVKGEDGQGKNVKVGTFKPEEFAQAQAASREQYLNTKQLEDVQAAEPDKTADVEAEAPSV